MNISILDPITPAWDRMKDILFRPFNIGKWFALGFSAWLMTLLSQGGGGSMGGGDPSHFMNGETSTWIENHLALIITLGVIFFIFVLIFILLMNWLSCRGRFIFLNQVITDTTLIKIPWRDYARQANGLFIWSLLFGLVLLLLMVPFFAGGFFLYQPLFQGGTWDASLMIATAALATAFILLLIGAGYVWFYTLECLAPLMWKHRCKVGEAWRLMKPLTKEYPFAFIFYPMVKAILSAVIFFGVMILIILTCCIAGILLIIPYIGAVVMLPITLFLTNYNLYFLKQFGPEYNVFADTEPPPVPIP